MELGINSKDITGMRSGKLTAIKVVGKSKRGNVWECQCDCGNTKNVITAEIINKSIKSCGCNSHPRISKKGKHNLSRTRLYTIHKDMVARCTPKGDTKGNYYARGIRVCKEWQGIDGLYNFCEWAKNNGYKDGLTLDRINNNGNYEPQNCQWVTRISQNNNRRNNVYLEYDGKKMSLAEWARETGINQYALWGRISRGWSVEDALTIPLGSVARYVSN